MKSSLFSAETHARVQRYFPKSYIAEKFKGKIYGRALARLRNDHPDDFKRYVEEEARKELDRLEGDDR